MRKFDWIGRTGRTDECWQDVQVLTEIMSIDRICKNIDRKDEYWQDVQVLTEMMSTDRMCK